MKKMLFLLAFALVALYGFAQNMDSLAVIRQVDSLGKVWNDNYAKGLYQEMLKTTKSASETVEKKFGKSNNQYARCINAQGVALLSLERFHEAELLFLEVKVIREKTFGKEHPAYAAILNNLALAYSGMGRLEYVEPFYLEVKAIREKTVGKEHPEYVQTMINLGNLYWQTGRYESAEPLFLEAKTICEKTVGIEHPYYATCLNSLAVLYMEMGRYESAEPLMLQVNGIEEKILEKKHSSYSNNLNNLGLLYLKMGRYEPAESFFLEAKDIKAKILGENSPSYAETLGNLANLYRIMGRYESAEPLYLQAKTIAEAVFGKEHPDYALSLNGLASLYWELSRYDDAESLYLEAKTIREKTMGKGHPDYASSLNNIAVLYMEMNRFDASEHLLLEAITLREKILGKEHPDYALSLNNLATLYFNSGRYESAEPLFLQAKAIREKSLGKEHPNYAQNLYNLAALYRNTTRREAAVPLLQEVNAINKHLLASACRHLSEQELSSYHIQFITDYNGSLSFATEQVRVSSSLFSTCFDNSLFYRGFLLNASNQIRHLAYSDSTTTKAYNLLKACHRRLAAEYAKPMADRKNVAELEEKANTLEKELARSVAGFGEAVRQVNWQEVQSNLKPDEAAVEFVHFQYYDKKGNPTDSILYAALLLRPDRPHPHMVILFEQKNIHSLLTAANTSAAADQLYATRASKQRIQPKKNEGIVVGIGETANLYQLIWKPIDSLLQGAKTVYFSPSGLLHRLNLSAVPVPPFGGQGGKTLADRYRLVQVGSTRQLVSGSSSGSDARTAALFGGLRFDQRIIAAPDTAAATATANYDVASIRRSLGARGGDTWNYLPGTEKEVSSIGKTLTKSGYSIQSFTGHDGSEAAFKAIGTSGKPSPAVLHIATHGFFFPDPKDTVGSRQSAVGSERQPVFKTSDNPLMRSGLILAGANRAWGGSKTPEGQEDGILTAYEISQMNLSNTELVVLSACETGLGDVAGNEGVYGLQRAFKIAGAKYLVMSLWQVPDKETSEFMATFYRKWLEEKMPVPDAFRAAQKEMRERLGNPYLWAGFVLVE